MQSEELYFRRADLFQDVFEGTITRPLAEAWARIADRVNAPKIEEVMSIGRKCARKTVYINCWHANNSESEAMWRLYCPNNQGIAIETTYTKLAEWSAHLPNSFIGKVTYLDYQKEKFTADNYLHAFMHKRSSFEHESEVRILRSEHEEFRKRDLKDFDELVRMEQTLSGLPSGMSFKFPLEENVAAIFVNPYAPDWYFEMFRKLINSLKPSMLKRLNKSALADLPYF